MNTTYLLEKYISVAREIPEISKKFKTFPTPKYLKITNVVKLKEIIKPRLELPMIIEKENRNAKNRTKKNKGKTPKVLGSKK